MSFFSTIRTLAKAAGTWVLSNPETVKMAADTASEMHENAKARRQAKEEAASANKEAVIVEELTKKFEALGQNQLDIVNGLTNTQEVVDSLNTELVKTKEYVKSLSAALEDIKSKLCELEAKRRKDSLIYAVGLSACLTIAIVISVVL